MEPETTNSNIIAEPISTGDLPVAPVPVAPMPITIDNLLQSVEVLQKKEMDDKVLLESISNMSYEELKQKLITWAYQGFPNVYEIQQIMLQVPEKCSDGQIRSLPEYITFCSGKSMHEHVALLNTKVTGITISFANMPGYIAIVVSKQN